MKTSSSLTLTITGLGHCPSFKNSKMITRGRLITDPKKQKWMDACIRSIEWQLRCWFLTRGIVTATEHIPLSKIVSSLPLEDSLKWIASHSVSWRKVKKGEEGAVIEIEQI